MTPGNWRPRWMATALAVSALCVSSASAQSVSYSYDGVGRLRSAIYVDGKVVVYEYDDAGNRTERVVSGEDLTPTAYDLGPPVTGAVAGAWRTSSIITVGGINSAAAISIIGGQFREDGGSWRTTATEVLVGQTVQVQVQAPATAGASQTATLNIGGVTDTFQVTTAP